MNPDTYIYAIYTYGYIYVYLVPPGELSPRLIYYILTYVLLPVICIYVFALYTL